jgi:hypothetical protein
MIKTNKALSLVESVCPLFVCLFIVYFTIRISMPLLQSGLEGYRRYTDIAELTHRL